jgi:hypothetical protein
MLRASNFATRKLVALIFCISQTAASDQLISLYLILFERQRRHSEIGERLLEGVPSGHARADFGGRFDPAEWRTAAEHSDHGNERWLARAP